MTSFVIQCALEKAKKIQNSSTWPISYVLISAKVRNQFPVYNLKTFSAQLWFLFSSVPIRLVLSNESSIHQRWRKFYQTLPYFTVLFMNLQHLYTPLFRKNITSNDRSFDCPIIYVDTIHNAILFIDILTMFDTIKLIL